MSKISGKYVGGTVIVLLGILLFVLGCDARTPNELHWIGIHALKGEIYPFKQDDGHFIGGLSLIGGQIKKIQTSNFPGNDKNLLLFADNSTIHGSPLAYLTRGEAIIRGLNELGLNALFVDSREFSFGTTRLEHLSQIAQFPLVSANIVNESGELPNFLNGYFYHTETKTGFISLASPLLLERNLPMFVQGISLLDPVIAVQKQIARIKIDYPDYQKLILMAVPFKVSESGDNSFVDDFLAIRDVDVVVVGQRDGVARLPKTVEVSGEMKILVFVNDVIHDGARAIDHVDIRWDGYRVEQQILPVTSDTIVPDQAMARAIFQATAPAQEMLQEQLSFFPNELFHRVCAESVLANYVLDLFRDYTGADIALQNTGALRYGIGPGPVTINSAYQAMPFHSNLVTMEITGKELLRVFERSAMYHADIQRHNGFLQISGGTYGVTGDGVLVPDLISIGGEPLELNRSYLVTTELFLAGGGDGYEEFPALPRVTIHPVLNFSLFVEGLRRKVLPDFQPQGRIIQTGTSQ